MSTANERYIELRDLTMAAFDLALSDFTSSDDDSKRWIELLQIWDYHSPANKIQCQHILANAFHYIKLAEHHASVSEKVKPLIEAIAVNMCNHDEIKDNMHQINATKYIRFMCTHCKRKRKCQRRRSRAHEQYLTSYLDWKLSSEPTSKEAIYVQNYEVIMQELMPAVEGWSRNEWCNIDHIYSSFKKAYRAKKFHSTDFECLFMLMFPLKMLATLPDIEALTPSSGLMEVLREVQNDEKTLRQAAENFFFLIDSAKEKACDPQELSQCYTKIVRSFLYKVCNYWLVHNRFPSDLVQPIKLAIFEIALS